MSGQISNLHILVVDDNLYMRKIVSEVLRAIGVKDVEAFGEAAMALDFVRQCPVDVAIVDFNMAPIDGVEFTRRIRQGVDGVNTFLPIIMLTAHSGREQVEKARDAGVTEFIIKPVTAQAIIGRLNTIINHPRPFVRSGDYFGPDRRRRTSPDYEGPRRRSDDAPSATAAKA